MGKDKGGGLTPKAIANRIKAKGLQKLRWYCQMCQKQCRDEVCSFRVFELCSPSFNTVILLLCSFFINEPNIFIFEGPSGAS